MEQLYTGTLTATQIQQIKALAKLAVDINGADALPNMGAIVAALHQFTPAPAPEKADA